MRLLGTLPLPSSHRPMPSSNECGRPCTWPLYSVVPQRAVAERRVVQCGLVGAPRQSPRCPSNAACGTACRPSATAYRTHAPGAGSRLSIASLLSSNGASTPRSLNCSARSCVGWHRSKPSPPVACSLLICSSFCENGVVVTLMPVAFSKSGISGLGSSSDQFSRLSAPEDDRASSHHERTQRRDAAERRRAGQQNAARKSACRSHGRFRGCRTMHSGGRGFVVLHARTPSLVCGS